MVYSGKCVFSITRPVICAQPRGHLYRAFRYVPQLYNGSCLRIADGGLSPEFKILTPLYSKNLQFKIISTICGVFGHNSGLVRRRRLVYSRPVNDFAGQWFCRSM